MPELSGGSERGSESTDRPQYTRYRSRPQLFRRGGDPEFAGLPSPRDRGRRRRSRKPLTAGRVIRYLVLAILGWLALSLVLFLVSAQLEQGKVSEAAESSLDGGGPLPFSANTILVLGSDARPRGTGEGGANVIGEPSRSDTMLLVRAGGGHSARLSIPRDTIVDIPGRGPQKINSAYAIGGPALAVNTVKQYLGIEVNHLLEVDFENFPKLIDAMGGIDYTGGCVVSNINGGTRNGGVTLKLKRGRHRLNGKEALALARTRRNECKPGEDDLDRARRQQKILGAMKGRLFSPGTFVRLPWVSWAGPKAIRSDMGGVSLIGLLASLAVTGSPEPQVLRPSSLAALPGGGTGLTVSEQEKRSAVRRFLDE